MKKKKNLISRLLFSAVLLACSSGFALAQTTTKDEYPKVEVFVGFSARWAQLAKSRRLDSTMAAGLGQVMPLPPVSRFRLCATGPGTSD